MITYSSNQQASTRKRFNLFNLFIYVITRVNYTGELLTKDDVRVKYIIRQHRRRRQRPSTYRPSALRSPLSVNEQNNSSSSYKDQYNEEFLNDMKEITNIKLNKFRESTAIGASPSSSSSSLSSIDDEDANDQLINDSYLIGTQSISRFAVGNTNVKLNKIDNVQCPSNAIGWQRLPECNLRLLIKMIISCFFILKCTFSFSIGKHYFRSLLNFNYKFVNELCEAILCDIYFTFKGRKMLNIVAASMLSSCAIYRAIKFGRYFIVRFSFNSKQQYQANELFKKELNIVQLNLSYLNSLKLTAKYWFELICNSWLHRHQMEKLELEQSLIENLTLFNYGHHLNSLDITFRMYLINMINFDKCYSHYSNSLEEQTFICNNQWLSIHRVGQSRRQSRANFYLNNNNKNIEDNWHVAKPTHRCDQNEMAWLLFFLFMLYSNCLATFVLESFCAFMLENQINQLSNSTNILSLSRCFQVSLCSLVSLLDVYDLFLFFASSLICSSRARYLNQQLRSISEKCFSLLAANNFNCHTTNLKQFEFKQNQYNHNLNDLYDCKSNNEFSTFLLPKFCHEKHEFLDEKIIFFYDESESESNCCISKSRKFISNENVTYDNSVANEINVLNRNLLFLIDLLLVLQRELTDIKDFFGLYLNLEIILKPICISYCIVSLLESEFNLELLFLILVTNHLVTPILVTTATATWIETEFKRIAWELDKIITNGGSLINGTNLRKIMTLSNHLNNKSNRSFVILGNFSLTLGSLLPLLAWIATGVVLFRRG